MLPGSPDRRQDGWVDARLGRALARMGRSRGGNWNLLMGLILMGLAIWFAVTAEYPVSRETSSTSAGPRVVLLPKPLAPLGEAEVDGLEFTWLWAGPEQTWELVLLDAAMEELVSVGEIRGTSLVPQGELLARLEAGGRFHWNVSYVREGQTYRSLPIPLVLHRR